MTWGTRGPRRRLSREFNGNAESKDFALMSGGEAVFDIPLAVRGGRGAHGYFPHGGGGEGIGVHRTTGDQGATSVFKKAIRSFCSLSGKAANFSMEMMDSPAWARMASFSVLARPSCR